MKFIHTSDWHLGRQLHHQSLLEDQAHVLEQIIAFAAEHEVDAVIVAGDIYDRSVPPAQAVALLDRVLTRLLDELKVKVIMIAGNHDGHERLSFAAKQMQASGLYIVGPLSATICPIVLPGQGGSEYHFWALPYFDPATARQVFSSECASHEQAMATVLEHCQRDNSAAGNILISHCFIDGGSESESERPLSIGGADKISPQLLQDFDYVALGHLHGPQYKGAKHVRYSGSILKYSFSEQHQHKSVTLVEFDADGGVDWQLLPLTPARDVRIIETDLATLLEEGPSDPANQDYVMVRLTDSHAILDAMAKVRQAYPNVLHLERMGLMQQNQSVKVNREHIQKGELNMFCDFFEQVSGSTLSVQQQDCVQNLIQSLHESKD
ncbi:exonuclease SbcCD subunit D [Motilimonas pumila]|uniref:Nuclease SbcCD subunit D n=1 Tax=Motilimonas pumila TaxID=2303987 RepID=A0A418YK60_9GAMM|nr:exonuclease SbcCD subunit D [Motilimonas pumila]RJG51349.1 exonuclease SbcCD subunit D [Motilimonas pumila]